MSYKETVFLFENDLANKQCTDDHNLLSSSNVMLKEKLRLGSIFILGGVVLGTQLLHLYLFALLKSPDDLISYFTMV